MGERGPAPRREAEVRRTNNKGKAEKSGPAELEALDFAVDLSPAWPEPAEDWHPMARMLWDSLETDPARKWMTSADIAATYVVLESLSRDLSPQVVGVTEDGQVVRATVPMKGANQTSFLKHLASIGVTEAARLRLAKEITLHQVPTIVDGDNVTDIKSARREGVV